MREETQLPPGLPPSPQTLYCLNLKGCCLEVEKRTESQLPSSSARKLQNKVTRSSQRDQESLVKGGRLLRQLGGTAAGPGENSYCRGQVG